VAETSSTSTFSQRPEARDHHRHPHGVTLVLREAPHPTDLLLELKAARLRGVFNHNAIPPPRPRVIDSTRAGTPDSYWQTELAAAPEWKPPPGPIIVVAAHPDDETFGAGGLIHSCAHAGHSVAVITVTDGEGARTDLQRPGTVRRREMRAALSCLSGRYIQWHRLGMPDGNVIAHEPLVERAIKTRLPADATLVAPFEHDGHTDHEAVARVCITLARRRGVRLLRYPIWAWHHSAPGAWQNAEFVRFELSASAQLAKSRAIRCFASQLDASTSHAVMPAHVLEYFTRPYEAFLVTRHATPASISRFEP
jgi:LmbE family N-acetylglucosaminyl deacetylase